MNASPSAVSPDAMAGGGACANSWTDCVNENCCLPFVVVVVL